jgi:hypothetical protein
VREERRLRMFEKIMPRKTFWPKREEVMGGVEKTS